MMETYRHLLDEERKVRVCIVKIFHGSQLLNLRRARKRQGIIKPEKTLETAGSTLQSLSSSQNISHLGLMPSLSSVFVPILGITAIIH